MSKASLELGGGNWGTKDGNLLGYAKGSEAGRFVPREFSFTRGSDIAATRINSSGVIEKYRENLLLQSNQFDTTWANNLGASGTIVNSQSGYDGSSDAWLLTKDATTFARVQQTLDTPISGVWTMSAYLKAGTATLSRFRFNSASYMVEFNFSTGVATDEGSVSAIDYGMTDVGNGWYRCYATFNASVSIAQIYVDYNTSTSTTMFVQDAQLEQGLVATEYIESGVTTGLSSYTTSADYTIQDSDDGYYLRVSQVETNSQGTDTAESIPTAFIATQETLAITNFTSRVEADGGSVESGSCLETDLTFLMNNP